MDGSAPLNILYYSRFCPHSNKVVDFIAKNGIAAELNCICVDRRRVGEGGQTLVQLENGKTEALPPMIDRVPALLLVKEKYQIRFGDDIIEHYKPRVKAEANEATGGNEGEPMAFNPDAFSSSFSAY
jgi:hypothetical protein